MFWWQWYICVCPTCTHESHILMTETYLCIWHPQINLWHLSCPASVEHISDYTAAPGMCNEENWCCLSKTKCSLFDWSALYPDETGSMKGLITRLMVLKTNQMLAWVIIDFLTATKREAVQYNAMQVQLQVQLCGTKLNSFSTWLLYVLPQSVMTSFESFLSVDSFSDI